MRYTEYHQNVPVIKDWTFKDKTFRDQVGNRSMALAELKRCQKEGLL